MGVNPQTAAPVVPRETPPAPREAGPSRVRAAIETLSLTGFPAVNTARVQAAFTSELSRLLTDHATRGGRWQSAPGDARSPLRLAFPAAPSAATLGERLARAVFERLTHPGEEARP